MSCSSACFTAIAFCLASIVVQSFGELIVFRHPLTDNGSKRKLTCISENDDAALIWNYNPTWKEAQRLRNGLTDFQPKKPTSKNGTDCAMWNSTQCLANWERRSGWEVVSSTIRPMGPVVDYRWEGFKEFAAKQTTGMTEYQYVGKIKPSGTAVFSVRGLREVHVLLCENENPTSGPCFQILIGGWWHRLSEIWTCSKGAPELTEFKTEENCENIARIRHGEEDILQAYEWRTFTLKWDSDRKSVQLFKESDPENEPFLQGYVKQWYPVSHISMRSGIIMRVRFHFYEYHTTDIQNSVLYTEEFNQYDEHFCVELLVGLCPKCKLNLNLMDSNGSNLNIGSISGDENSVYNGLMTWRSVKLNVTLQVLRSRPVKLEIQTILTGGEGKGQWAIDNLRMCQSAGQLRQSTITIPANLTEFHEDIWPEVWCQKLSYSQSALVGTESTRLANNMSQSQQLVSGWLASCASSCKNFGKEWSICNTAGCTCDRGFTGSDCNEECPDGHYGYNCADECGSCDNGYCNTTTGYCSAGCTTNEVLPPFCKTEASKTEKILDIQELRTTSISDTEVTIRWKPLSSKNEIIDYYNVSIKMDTLLGCDHYKKPTPVHDEIFKTVKDPEVSFSGLHPYAKYNATVVAYATNYGEPEILAFRTSEKEIPTSKVANLRLTSDKRGLQWDGPADCTTITGTTRVTRLYFAGVSDSARNWSIRKMTAYRSLNLKSLGLIPYTNYSVRAYVLRSYYRPENSTSYEELTWRTPPTAPPAVTKLEIYETDLDASTISLRWIPPNPANGEIESYHVSINQTGLFENRTIKVSEGIMMCELSSNYVCLENMTLPPGVATHTRVQVYAKNKDVEQPGDESTVLFSPEFYQNMAPGTPLNFEAIPQHYGSVMLTWAHPLFVYSKITRFEIVVGILQTDLLDKPGSQYPMKIDYPVARTQKEYSVMLHLLPSTVYSFSIVAVNRYNVKSRQVEVSRLIPGSVGFENKTEPQTQFSGSSIEVRFPKIVNATENTRLKVIVKGLSTCAPNQLQESLPLANQTSSVMEWDAAIYYVANHVPESLEISAEHNHGVTLQCSLHLETAYTIFFVLTDWYSSTSAELSTSPITLTQSWSKLVSYA